MTVATPTRIPTMPAKRESDCPLCPDRINTGAWIGKVRPGWCHFRCAEQYLEAVEFHHVENSEGDE